MLIAGCEVSRRLFEVGDYNLSSFTAFKRGLPKKTKPLPVKVCVYCKKRFRGRTTRKFCSQVCYRKWYREHPRKRPERGRRSMGQKIRHTREYQEFKERVMKREHGVCQLCDKPAVDVHHKIPLDIAPELATDDSNGIALCLSCHRKKHPKLPDKFFENRSC